MIKFTFFFSNSAFRLPVPNYYTHFLLNNKAETWNIPL